MACCSGKRSCTCYVDAGDNIDVGGDGSSGNPYVISTEIEGSDFNSVFTQDSNCIRFEGDGTPGNPLKMFLIFDPDSPTPIAESSNGLSLITDPCIEVMCNSTGILQGFRQDTATGSAYYSMEGGFLGTTIPVGWVDCQICQEPVPNQPPQEDPEEPPPTPVLVFPLSLDDNPTGPKTALPENTGNFTTSSNDQVVDGLNANTITVNHDNVTIRNFSAIQVINNGTNLILEDGIINGNDSGVPAAVRFDSYTARRLEVTGCEDGFKAGDDTTIEYCWIHDLTYNPPTSHCDGIQMSGGGSVYIHHSRFENIRGTAAIFAKPDFGDIDGVVIDSNYITEVGNYFLQMSNAGAVKPINITITNNTFGAEPAWVDGVLGPGTYYRSINADNVTWSNNKLEDGTVIPL